MKTYPAVYVELGEQVLEDEVAVGPLAIHWNAACGALHAQ